jgi:amino acid transporter
VRFSEDIASAGGLAAFVQAAAGRRLALAQAAVWAFSYFLYLPYTVTDVVYEQLVVPFPGIAPWRWLLELALPLAIVALLLLGTRPALRVLLVSAVAQLAVLLVLGGVLLRHRTHAAPVHHVVHGSAVIALLFVCGSLPLFLGAEVTGGRRTVRRTLVTAGVVVAVYLVFALWWFPSAGDEGIPGYDVALATSGRTLAVVVGLGAAISVTGVIVAEYLALSRLLSFATGMAIPRLIGWIAVPFVGLDALSLLGPDWFDEHVLRWSLVALYLSQLVVFAVYPLYRSRRGRLTPLDVVVAAIAFALMAYGLWRGLTAPVST